MRRALPVAIALLLASCSSPKPAVSGHGGEGGSAGGGGSGGVGPCADEDRDGFPDATCGGTDCDDADATVHPGALELCKDGVDQDCDGEVDEGCNCSVGEMRPCWSGAASVRGVGQCADGWQRCDLHGAWSVCAGEIAPGVELATCDGIDQDCDGHDAPACAACGQQEMCGNGIDDDCTGTIDDPTACSASCLPAEGKLPACCGDGSCTDLGCEDRTGQNCYSGPPGTLGRGVCHAGRASCTAGAWGACEGEVTPGMEVCGNGLDDDCDGLIDESDAAGRRCPRTDCGPAEVCDNGLDDDCNGFVDEGCAAKAAQQPCYPGPLVTRDRGVCTSGVQSRQDDGYWGPCIGAIVPAGERCGDQLDTDCNGAGGPGQAEDAGCCTPSGAETCNGVDDDCDGLVDEGLLSSCGNCAMSCPGTLGLDVDTCDGPGRTCAQIEVAAGGGLAVDLSGPALPADPGIYFLVSNNVIRRFDTSTGTTAWDYTMPTVDASIYAASLDGSLWVDAPEGSELLHVGKDGSLACSFHYPADHYLTTLAVDETGAAWPVFASASGDFATLYRFPADSLSDATCVPARLTAGADPLTLDVTEVGRIVAAGPPVLWLTAGETSQTGLRLNRETLEQTRLTLHSTLGGHPAVDENGTLWYIDRSGSIVGVAQDDDGTHPTTYGALLNEFVTTGTGDGRLWGVLASSFGFGYLDLATGKSRTVALSDTASQVQGVTTDATGRLWVHAFGNSKRFEASYEPSTQQWTEFLTQQPAFNSYDSGSYRSSAPQQRYVGRQGKVVQVLDGGLSQIVWSKVRWTSDLPAGTSMRLTVKVTDIPDGDLSGGCGPFATSPADLSSCAPSRGRYLRLEFALQASRSEAPVLKDASAEYQRP